MRNVHRASDAGLLVDLMPNFLPLFSLRSIRLRLALIASLLALSSACGTDGAERDDDELTSDASSASADDDGGGPSTGGEVGDPRDAGGPSDAGTIVDVPFDAAPTPVLSDLVETVTLESAAGDGEGNAPEPSPIALLEDGTACRDLDFVFITGGDPAAHRAALPDAWARWTKNGDELALEGDDQHALQQRRYEPLTRGERLDGAYARPTAEAYATDGVRALLTEESRITFLSDGRFTQGSPTEPGTDAGATADYQGTYEIDGYRLFVQYDSGGTATTTILFDPSDPTAVFIGGRAFIREDG